MRRPVLSRAPQWLLVAVLACAPLASGAQVSAPAGLPAGSVVYQTREVSAGSSRVGVVSAAYAVGQDGTAEPLAFGSISGLARALAVVSNGDALRLAGGRDVRSGWVAVEVGEGVPVMVGGSEVAKGSVHLRMDPGSYRLSFGEGTEPQSVRVQARASLRVTGPSGAAPAAPQTAPQPSATTPEATPAEPSATRSAAPAPRSSGMQSVPRDAAMRRLIATSPFARGQGGETTPDSPLVGWTMPVPPPEAIEEAPPAAAAPPPVAMRRSPVAGAEPGQAPPPEASGEDPMDLASCPAPDGADDKAATDELILAGTYSAARACIVRHITRVPDDLDAVELNTVLERIVIAERAMAEETLLFLASLREQVQAAADEEELEALDTAANRLLSIFPGDLSTVRRLRAAHARTVTPVNGEGVDFAYVPGAAARLPNDLSTRNVANPPALGFLLSKREITNAEYVHFLNGINEKSDNPYLIRRPENLALTRTDGWQPVPGAADLPIVDVTWFGAEAYAKWLGGRLPTETEWEWAYRMGGGSDGSDANLGSGPRKIRDVNASRPDQLGLHDMLGNVWEWLDGEAWEAQSRGVYTRRGAAGGSFSSPPATIHSNLVSTTDALLPAGHIGFRVYLPASGDDDSE